MRRNVCSNFLKLSNRIINTKYIEQIIIKNDNYKIYLISKDVGGFFLFSSGGVSTKDYYIEVCKNENLSDYTIVNNWINKNV